ncbi:Kazrin [Manis pentadactyla]|nr:Kazrin [Manis pentadactyla]
MYTAAASRIRPRKVHALKVKLKPVLKHLLYAHRVHTGGPLIKAHLPFWAHAHAFERRETPDLLAPTETQGVDQGVWRPVLPAREVLLVGYLRHGWFLFTDEAPAEAWGSVLRPLGTHARHRSRETEHGFGPHPAARAHETGLGKPALRSVSGGTEPQAYNN